MLNKSLLVQDSKHINITITTLSDTMTTEKMKRKEKRKQALKC